MLLALAMRGVPSARSPSLLQRVCRENTIICASAYVPVTWRARRDPRGQLRTAADGCGRLRTVEILAPGVVTVSVTGMWKTCGQPPTGAKSGADGLAATARRVRQLLGGWCVSGCALVDLRWSLGSRSGRGARRVPQALGVVLV